MTPSTPLTIPKLGLTMTEATLAEWAAENGKHFEKGDVVAVIETDKVSYEVNAPSAGVLGTLHAQVGDILPVGAVIADWHPDLPGPDMFVAQVAKLAAPITENGTLSCSTAQKRTGSATSGRIVATPLAKRIARQEGIDLAQIQGSGPRGRIKAIDVQRTGLVGDRCTPRPAATPAELDTVTAESVPLSRIAKAMANRMVESKRDIPHFYMTMDVDATALLLLRKQLCETGQKVSLTHLLLAAVVRCLGEDSNMRRVWSADHFRLDRTIDVGLAVDSTYGLFSPVLRDLEPDDLLSIVRKADGAIQRARENKLMPDDIGGGCVSISNAGVFGVKYVTPIIVPGQSAIIGVGAVSPVFRPDDAGQPALRQELGLVISADHRIHTGASVARFMNLLKTTLEQPLTILLRRSTV
jgi:pyruvate dehydrogenase E2 component (dihydrolipoamide acetyltransferase)